MYVACGNDPNPFRPYLGYSDIRAQKKLGFIYLSRFAALGGQDGGRCSQLSAAYTYSHSIDDASSASDAGS